MSFMSDMDVRVQMAEAKGFVASLDTTAEDYGEEAYLRIRCTQCEALVINNVATHESGCPNAMRECAGCYALIPRLQFRRFCDDCQ